ncbi:recombination regulator RecX [Patescibacteria group bacterium]|nr:recombination regulator RecX [Patescibacteria group bacterium]MBU1703501.1 recombination regulator RecX [Patescibacteria group bacterium]MBU1954193.1 recombination regulator RecX [Patescibacteria group bacterium]
MEGELKKLYAYAVALLARRDYHSSVLREKLLNKGIGGEEEVEAVLQNLKKKNFINDDRYVEKFIEEQFNRRPQSIRLVKQKLVQKGIRGETVDEELKKHAAGELTRAQTAARKKAGSLQNLSPLRRKEKLFRFLCARGFSQSTIMEALK